MCSGLKSSVVIEAAVSTAIFNLYFLSNFTSTNIIPLGWGVKNVKLFNILFVPKKIICIFAAN